MLAENARYVEKRNKMWTLAPSLASSLAYDAQASDSAASLSSASGYRHGVHCTCLDDSSFVLHGVC